MASRKMAIVLGLAGCLWWAPGVAADDKRVVAFNASVRVEVDAAGKPVKVEAPADLPEAIRGYIEKRVASWQYQPAKVAGVARPAVTYVAVNACAVPVSEGFRLGLDFDGNGPRRVGDRPLPPPVYPPRAQMAGTEADFVLILDLRVDGTAEIDSIESAEFRGRSGRAELQQELHRWVKSVRFDMEMVDGHAVPSRIRIPVLFTMGPRGGRDALIAELQAKAQASRECLAASAEASKPVALESVVTVIPSPAG